MNNLKIRLQHCYGIKKLDAELDFARGNAYAIYAPNGVMKSSLARTFKDIAEGKESGDLIFTERATIREVTDETGAPLDEEAVLVLPPYDAAFGHTEKTSTLLVDQELRKEYETLHAGVERAKASFLTAMKKQAGFRKNIEEEISSAFTKSSDEFHTALMRVKDEVREQDGAPLADVPYSTLFDPKVLAFLETGDFRVAIDEYIRRYNELLDSSTYFRPGVFTYYNAETVANTLAKNGFFDARHSVTLHASEDLEVTDQKQLEDLITQEKSEIASDPALREKFGKIDKMLTKNASLRAFQEYISANEEILPQLSNVGKLKEDVWKSYFKVHEDGFEEVIETYQDAKARRDEIHAEAAQQGTQWQAVIDIFNSRFFVPFTLQAKNRVSVMLGEEPMLELGFIFKDGPEEMEVEKAALMDVLSTGEKKALYILNILFEVEVRKSLGQPTVIVFDDIADSFDYKNKYAIIQYLKDMADEDVFKHILLTHNFDFFRTVNSRFVSYPQCLMAERREGSIELVQAAGIRNVFVKDWKRHFFTDLKKRIASIPFIRNLVEYTHGKEDPRYTDLTSLLHLKAGSRNLTQADLDRIYSSVFQETGEWSNPEGVVVEDIVAAARDCLSDSDGVNFENKIVLAIAIRLGAEEFMIERLGKPELVAELRRNQTIKLLKMVRELPDPDTVKALPILERVVLMTPENIHLNSFMYEPILDMSDEHLRTLFSDVQQLNA